MYNILKAPGRLVANGALILTAASFLAFASPAGAQAVAQFTDLHDFAVTEGSAPEAALIQLADGSLWGTTVLGGMNSTGTLFQLSAANALTTVYSFPLIGKNAKNSTGAFPHGSLIQAPDNKLYTTTSAGGAQTQGSVVAVDLSGAAPAVSDIFDFGNLTGNGTNGGGAAPEAGLTLLLGNLYGTTSKGGGNGDGSVYEIAIPTQQFSTRFDITNAFGSDSRASLSPGPSNSLYATCSLGGPGGGSVFQIFGAEPPMIVAAFSALDLSEFNASGAGPVSPVVAGAAGAELGAARDGGTNGTGLIYQLTGTSPVPTAVHVFEALDENGFNTGGAFPVGLAFGPDGNFYGVNSLGGANGNGTVFQMTPAGAITVLHTFGATDGNQANADGARPQAGLVLTSQLTFSGTTEFGGASGRGTIFSFAMTPTFTGAATATGSVGVPFSYQVAATNSPTAYSATGLPAGLSVDPTAGSITGSPTQSGSFTATLMITNAFGVISAPLAITVTLPTVTLSTPQPTASVASGIPGIFTLTLSAPQPANVIVNYAVKGSAANGTDYVFLSGQKKIKAGKTSKSIQIIPQGDLGGEPQKAVKLSLLPNDGVYDLGPTIKGKVKIVQ